MCIQLVYYFVIDWYWLFCQKRKKWQRWVCYFKGIWVLLWTHVFPASQSESLARPFLCHIVGGPAVSWGPPHHGPQCTCTVYVHTPGDVDWFLFWRVVWSPVWSALGSTSHLALVWVIPLSPISRPWIFGGKAIYSLGLCFSGVPLQPSSQSDCLLSCLLLTSL